MFIALGSEANSLVFHEISAVFLGGKECPAMSLY